MDYGSTIRKAWQLTWRHRFLWILGLFVPSATGTWWAGGGGRSGAPTVTVPASDISSLPPDLNQPLVEAGRWLTANWLLIVLVIGFAILIGLAMLVASLVAQGGMVHATAALARGEPMRAGIAWRRGLALAWRYLGLTLLIAAVVIMISIVAGALAAAVGFAGSGEPVLPRIALMIVLLAALFIIVLPFGIALMIATTFAQRAIAIENRGPLEALRQGLQLLRAHLGTSALAWLITVGLSLGAGLAIILSLTGLLVVLGGLGLGLYLSTGVSAALIAYGVVAGLATIAVAWVLSAIANTFFWTFWTLVYLHLTEPTSVQLALAA